VSQSSVANARRLSWMRVIAGGAFWAAVYNLVWGAAWFVFMRREWRNAFADQASVAFYRGYPDLLDRADLTDRRGDRGVRGKSYGFRLSRKSTAIAWLTLWLTMTVGMVLAEFALDSNNRGAPLCPG